MKKRFQERKTLWKEIVSWVLVIAILFTSADMSAFVVGAEDAFLDFNDTGAAPPAGDVPAAAEGTFTDGFTDGGGDIYYEETPLDVPEELHTFTLKLFEDANKNGLWDEGEAGIEGISADVRNGDTGEVVSAMTAAEPGIYIIEGIPAGLYHMMLTAPPEMVSLYDLAESVKLSPQKDMIRFPEAEEAWFLSYAGVDITAANEFSLGLQRTAPAETIPEPTPAETIPEPTPAETAPELTPAETAPQPTPAETIPEPTPAETIPEPTPAETAPEPTPAETIPEPTPAETIPEPTPAETTPEPTPAETTPEPTPEELRPFTLKVFEDTNKNGLWDEGEAGIEGISADFRNGDTGEVISALTAAEPGTYIIEGMPSGIYDLMLSAPLETISLYNLAESANTSAQMDSIRFPEAEEAWFLSYAGVDAAAVSEFSLGLQRDDLDAIEEASGNAEDAMLFSDGEGGALMAAPQAYATGLRFSYNPNIYYDGRTVDVAYYDANGKRRALSNYCWIRNTAEGMNDRKAVYCVEPFVNYIDKGNYYTTSLESAFGKTKADQIMLYAYYGADYPWPERVTDAQNGWPGYSSIYKSLYFMAAQSLIWELCGANSITWYSVTAGGTHFSSPINLDYYKNNIKAKVANHSKTPALPQNQKIDHIHENPDKIYAFSDSNRVLGNTTETWEIESSPSGVTGAHIDRQRNELRFKLAPGTAVDGKQLTFVLKKRFTSHSAQTMYASSAPRCQSLVLGGSPSPITYTWTVTVNPSGFAKIKKEDDAGHPVQGVTFRWGWDKNNLNQFTAATNDMGEVSINTNTGTIYIQEYQVPEHLIKDDTIKSVQIKSGQTSSVTFTNTRQTRKVSLRKVNSVTGKSVEGVRFKYWDEEKPDITYTGVTDSLGELVSSVKFPVGTTVVMEEVEPAPGYETLPEEERIQRCTVQLNESQNVFSFRNTPKKVPITIKKLNERTNKPIEGVKFRVTAGTKEYFYTTGPDGIITTEPLFSHGEMVQIQEVECPEQYVLDKTIRTLFIDANKQNTHEIVIYNHESPITLRIKKEGSDGRPLDGVLFYVEEFDGQNWNMYEGGMVTNEDGILTLYKNYSRRLLAEGWYRLVEVTTVPGYNLLEKPYVFDKSLADSEENIITVTVVNEKIPTSVTVLKYDEDSAKPLPGAVFQITDSSGRVVETLTTNKGGTAYTTALLADTQYYIEEVVPPYGYKKSDEGRIPLKLEESNKYEYKSEVPNEPYYGQIKVQKVDQNGQGLPGIEFTIYKGYLPIETLVTNEEGYAETTKPLLADSKYRIVETYAPPQYISSGLDYEFEFLKLQDGTIEDDPNYTLTFDEDTLTASFEVTNEEIFGSVTIEKVDAEDNTIPVKGAEFKLTNRMTGEEIDTKTTDENGICKFEDLGLVNPTISDTQGYYSLEEITPGENHILPENTKKDFSLTAAEKNRDITVRFENPPVKGNVEITKVDKDDPEKTLEGAVFTIYDVDDPDTVIDTAETGEDGIARFEDLRYGTYIIKETEAPPYYQNDIVNGGNEEYWDKNLKGYVVKIDEDGQLIQLTITNPKLQVQVQIVKYAEGKGYKLGGAEFGLYNAEGTLLETIVTAQIQGSDTGGIGVSKKYDAEELKGAYIQETKAPVGYMLDDTKYELEFDETSEEPVVIFKQEVENKMDTPELKIHKVDEKGNGVWAEFSIDVLDSNGSHGYFGDKGYAGFPYLVETSKEDPVADLTKFMELFEKTITDNALNPNATYEIYFEETKVDAGYQRLDGKFFITFSNREFNPSNLPEGVTYDKETLTITVVNKAIPVELTIAKKDDNGSPLSGAIFRITPEGQPENAVEAEVTDPNGTVKVTLPYAENYLVEEIQAPPGYYKMPPRTLSIKDFTWETDRWVHELELPNVKEPVLKIRKVDAFDTEKGLDAEFRVKLRARYQDDTDFETIVTTKASEDGWGTVDMSVFEPFFNDVGDWAAHYGEFLIEEIKVNSNYELLKEPIRIGFSQYENGKIAFDPGFGNVFISEDGREATVTIPNHKKQFWFKVKKAAEGDDEVYAHIRISAWGYENLYEISTKDFTDVTGFFYQLNQACPVTIEELDTNAGYEIVRRMGFWYDPEAEGINKFQDRQGPIKFSYDKEESEFEITITNNRSKMRLYLNKTDENGNPLAGATFKVETQNPTYSNVYVTTGNPDEYIEFPYAETITLTETAPPPGYDWGTERRWDLTASEFKNPDGNQSIYEYRINNGEPIINKGTYNLGIQKVDENEKPAEATFKLVNTNDQREWTVSTENGVANLNPVVKDILEDYPNEQMVSLSVTEIETEDGLLLKTGLLATISVYPGRIINRNPNEAWFRLDSYDSDVIGDSPINGSSQSLVLQVKNNPIPVRLTLIKQEEGTGKYLADAEFEITCRGGKSNGKKLTVTTTGTAEGDKVVLPWADSYIIRETKAPKGYILDPTVHEYTLDDFEDQKEGEVLVAKNLSETYTNTPVKGKLQITKVDEEDGNTLEGAEFEIYQGPLKDGDGYKDVTESAYIKVGEITIEENGTGTSGELPYGEYLLKETKAPENYQLTKEIYSAEISKEDETVYVRIPNEKLKGTLKIIKQDKEDETPLANAVFTVHDKDTDKQVGEPLVTDETGTVSAELPYGSYYFKEVSFPSGYAPATGETYPFILNKNQVEVKQEIPNTKTVYALRLFKEDAETGEYLAGAEFGLFKDNADPKTEDPIQRFTTRADGSAVVFLAESGPYDIYELKAPAGYELLKQKFEITVTEEVPTVEIVVENTKQNLTIEIHKTDEKDNKPLPGAVFEIRNGKTGALVATTDQTNEDGTVSVSVPAGEFEYTVTEIKAPEGYVLDPTPRPVTINTEDKDGQVIYTAEPVELTNHLISGNIKLIKKDVNGEKLLEGAVFGVYNSAGELVETLTTNSQGEAMSKELAPGKYTLKELDPPPGYEESEKSYEAELTAEQKLIEIVAFNTPKTGGFKVKKQDAQDNAMLLPGAEFGAYTTREDAENKQNPAAEATTGENGLAVFTDLPYGLYYVRETKAPEGYKLSERIYTVTVDEDSAKTVLLEVDNYKEPETGIFRVRKSDADTGEYLKGAVFTVTGADVTYNKEYTTDADGTFTTDPLEPGTYTVTETKAPEGYRISENPTQEVTVKAGDGIGAQVTEYEFTNEKLQFPIRVVKTDDSQEPKPLPGAVFELYRLGEGEEKKLLETLVTDMNGKAVSTMLAPGRYEVVEVTPPVGYELANPASQTVVITEETKPSVTEFTVTFKNSPETGSLRIRKVGLTEGETPDENFDTPLQGAVFEAVHAETGETYKAVSDENGEALFKDLPFGIYHVKETKVPEGYEENRAFEETVLISRETAGDGPVVIERTAYNYKQYGHVMLMKTDSETGTLVGGARYGIYTELNPDNETVNELTWLGEDYDLVSSSSEAYVTSKPLELGTYHIKERVSPSGYELNPKIYTVTITAETPIIRIDAEDVAKKGRVTIYKEDDSNPPKRLAGAVFALYKAEDYDNPPEEGEIPALYATTNEEGIAVFENLTVGQEYVLKEFTAPDGYKLSEVEKRFTPTVDSEDELEFTYTFTNKDKKELIIHKKGENGEIISDVMFTIYTYGADNRPETSDDDEVDIFSPSLHGDGIARYDISDLPNGWYYVKETQGSMAGFVQSEDIFPFEITDETEDIEFDFINYRPRGEIEIQKKDENGKPLPGAEFDLYYAKAGWPENPNALDWAYKIPMDENGHGILRDIPAGVYVLRETKVPEGYKKMPDKTIVMYLEGEEQEKDGKPYYYYYEEVVNEPITGWISVQKRAVLGEEVLEGIDLSGAEFKITDADDKVVDTLITGADGKATSKELPEGTYTITETKAPAGTTLNPKPGTVTIDGKGKNDIYTYTHDNEVLKGRIQIKKVDADDPNKTLKGAEFSILRDGETEPQIIVIGDSGIGTSDYLPYGWYTIRETKAPEGYILNENLVLHCQIKEENQTVEVEVENFKESKPGDFEIIIVKHDKDNPNHYLEGAKFDLYADEKLSEPLNDEPLVTGEKGRLKLDKELKDKLQTGITYYLKETKAPEGYALDDTPHSFTLTEGEGGTPQSIALYIPNERDKGYIKFEKRGEMLKDVVKGSSDYPNLHTLIWEEGIVQGAEIGIYATDKVELDGKTYYEGELIQRLQSGETSQPLPLGTYKYKELAAPESYIPDEEVYKIILTEADATVDAKPRLVTIKNTHASVNLTLHKRFEVESDNTADKLKTVKFGVYADRDIMSNGVTIRRNTLLGVMNVDGNGVGKGDFQLPSGPYYLMEIETYEGYVLDGKHYPFTVDYQHQNQTIEISSEENPILNEKVYGAIRLEKKGKVFSRVERLVNQEGKYQVNRPIYEEGMLKGAEVEIRAKTEVTIDGKTFKPGDVVDTLISGEKDESRRLPLGTYTLVETKAPEGYLLNSTPQDVEITANTDPNKPSIKVHQLENKKAAPELSLYKSFFGKTEDEAAELYSKVLFGIYAAEEIHGANTDAILHKDDLVGLIRMDKDGTGTLKDTLLPLGKYYVKELETAEGYQISEKTYPFTVSADTADKNGTGVKDIVIEGIDKDNPVVNVPNNAKVPFAFQKVGEDGDPLAGAVFRLYTCTNTESGHSHSTDAENAAEGCWIEVKGASPKTSGADGIVDFGFLPDGIYQLKETDAPEGYVLPAGQWRFRVDSTKQQPDEQITFEEAGAAKPPAFRKVEGQLYQYQVSNRRVRPMPFTGGSGLPGYLGGGGALVALSELIRRRRRKKK